MELDAGATEHQTFVRLKDRSRFFHSEETILGLQDSHALRISWGDAQHLVIECEDCGFGVYTYVHLSNWRDVSIQYLRMPVLPNSALHRRLGPEAL